MRQQSPISQMDDHEPDYGQECNVAVELQRGSDNITGEDTRHSCWEETDETAKAHSREAPSEYPVVSFLEIAGVTQGWALLAARHGQWIAKLGKSGTKKSRSAKLKAVNS